MKENSVNFEFAEFLFRRRRSCGNRFAALTRPSATLSRKREKGRR